MKMIWAAFVLALRSVRRNKLRATLTVLGILIGVTAVVIVTALGDGAKKLVGDTISGFGSNAIIVFPQASNASGARGAQGAFGRLSMDDGRAMLRESTSIKAWAPIQRSSVQVVWEGHNVATSAFGSTRSYFQIRAWDLQKGDLWEESAETLKERVCVVGSSIQLNLFGTVDAVGQTIRVGRHTYRVVGVLAEKGQSPFGGDQDDLIVMPFGTYQSHISGGQPTNAGTIMLSAASADVNDRAVEQVTEILKQRHHIGEGKEPDFVVRSQAEFQATQGAILGAVSLLLICVAGVSLVVGGIGVMNIMLVSVTERTREIGIRMAIGAQEADILVQFLVEAVVLSLLGGVAGIILSFTLVRLASLATGTNFPVSIQALGIALATSTTIGLVFGFFPARRAARLDPIVALRRE